MANLKCPECGTTAKNPQGLAAHRRAAHGVQGTSRNAKRAPARRATRTLAGWHPIHTLPDGSVLLSRGSKLYVAHEVNV